MSAYILLAWTFSGFFFPPPGKEYVFAGEIWKLNLYNKRVGYARGQVSDRQQASLMFDFPLSWLHLLYFKRCQEICCI